MTNKLPETEKPNTPPESKPKDSKNETNPWDAIEVGSKVLAKSTEPGEDGYWVSIVEKISADGKTLTLKWAMYPKLPSFNVRRLSVGILAKIGK